MTDIVLSKLRSAFENTCTDEEACAYAGIGVSTLYLYQKEHPEFLDEKTALKLKPNVRSRSTIISNLDQVAVAQWWAERRMKKEFSTRQEIAPINPDEDDLSEEEKQKLRKIIRDNSK